MNDNTMLGQVLGGLFGQALGRRGTGGTGGLGGGLGGVALGGILGGLLGGRRSPVGVPAGRGMGSNRTALLVMLLPLAMRWIQRNGGVGAVLDKFRQQGYGRQTQSWVSTGQNDGIDEQAVEQVVGQGELQQMAQRLGVPEHEVAQAFAEIMPEMVDKLTPQGQLPDQADDVLDESRQTLEKEIEEVQQREANAH